MFPRSFDANYVCHQSDYTSTKRYLFLDPRRACYTTTVSKIKHIGKIILFDTLAGLCFIGVIAFGWLPGPGGLPLFLAGLALLAANHEWAERWLHTVKVKGKSLKGFLFPNVGWVKNSYDLGAILMLAGGFYMMFTTVNRLLAAFSIMVTCLAAVLFVFNRGRSDNIKAFTKKLLRK